MIYLEIHMIPKASSESIDSLLVRFDDVTLTV